jgi:hypothetical protein
MLFFILDPKNIVKIVGVGGDGTLVGILEDLLKFNIDLQRIHVKF